jgi:hypothetical protein
MIDPEAPVRDPADFVGQAGLVRRVFSRIGAERPQSVAVIGGRRSGKTSLLAYLSDPGVRRRSLEAADRYLFAQPRGDSGGAPDPDGFLAGLLAQLPAGPAGGGNRYEAMRHAIEEFHGAGRRLVVLLDDFHLVTGSDRFPLEFFSFLRSMANNFNVAYVTTSFLELQKLCAAKDVQESPFFNIFTNLHLGMLSPSETAGLVAALAGVAPGDASRVAAWLGGSPYLARRAAARLAGAAAGVPADEAGLERLLYPEAAPYFEEVLALLPPVALRPLQALARGRQPDAAEGHRVAPLVKQGLLAESDDGLACASPAFAAFLRRGLAPRMLRGRE